jgi:hypothetical protein
MSTIRSQIVTALITALNTGRPAGVSEATRIRQAQFEPSDIPTVSVYPGDESIKPATSRPGPLVLRELQIVVEARVAGDAPDELLDPTVSWIEQAVTRIDSPLIHDAPQAVAVQHEFAIGAVPHGVARVSFVVRYQTRRDSPEAAS